MKHYDKAFKLKNVKLQIYHYYIVFNLQQEGCVNKNSNTPSGICIGQNLFLAARGLKVGGDILVICSAIVFSIFVNI